MSGAAAKQETLPYYIRRATKDDSSALSYICLATADAGKSAEKLHTAGELPGLVYAEPYVHLPTGFGFVLVDPSRGEKGEAVGYVLATWDTETFEKDMKETWLPPYLEKYPLAAADADAAETMPAHLRELTLEDRRFVRLLHNPHVTPAPCLSLSPAHLHIDILADYQRQGWGTKLIKEAVGFLKEEKGLNALWLGLDPRNMAAKRFYQRIGFKSIPGAPDNMMGLQFEDWVSE